MIVTVCDAAGQVKFADDWVGVSIEPAVADHWKVMPDAFGATAPAASDTTPPGTCDAGVALADVHVAQLTGVPLTSTPPEFAPPSAPVALQVRNTFTSVVVCAWTLNVDDVPMQVTAPSGDVAVSVIGSRCRR